VFQDLRYLSGDIDNTDIIKNAHLLGIGDKFDVEEFQISDTDLSFGQRGRVNLMRVLLENKDIYLLDEWAANQDPYFRSKFYNEIIPKLKSNNKTIVVISHDERYYHLADRLVTLSAGRLETELNNY
jgi:ABC-type siderophore export system fused ATPase/permease subunit